MMNKEFFKKNRNKYIQEIENKTITILFSGFSLPKSADQDFPFEVNKNFYYMTGIKQEQTILVIIKNDSKIEEMLFITENDPVLSKWQGKKITKEEASSISGIDAIHYLGAFDNTIFTILNNTSVSLTAQSLLPTAYKIVALNPSGSASADLIIECIGYQPKGL